MTQVTMPDLAESVRALEARKALLSGAVAALAAPDGRAAELFEAALADPGARWPFDLARVHLLYGERLRRSRQITRSRHHLQTALTAFEFLGASAWAERAAGELSATTPGQRRETGTADPLTAQELQVAELAAAGLSNKQIGARLYMSHRTVSAQLARGAARRPGELLTNQKIFYPERKRPTLSPSPGSAPAFRCQGPQ
jgi:DNA-binding CsgD family transcriptional regulator